MKKNKKSEQLKEIRNYVEKLFCDDFSGHDFFHMERVAKMSTYISQRESADHFICEAAGWLHDVGDSKIFKDPQKNIRNLEDFLSTIFITNEEIRQIKLAIEDVSYRKGKIPRTLEGMVVQDSDRIDALGAIGIARTFAFGGAKGQAIFHNTAQENTSLQHFYDKLLKLKETMYTATAKNIANERHEFIEMYLQQFLKEWTQFHNNIY